MPTIVKKKSSGYSRASPAGPGWRGRSYLLAPLFFWAVYASVLIPPRLFWPAAFVALSIPVVATLAALWLALEARRKRVWPIVAAAAAMLPSIIFIPATMQPLRPYPINETADIGKLTVCNFNVANFGGKRSRESSRVTNADGIFDWLAANRRHDVLLLQETLEHPTHETFRPAARLRRAGYPYHYFSKAFEDDGHGPRYGMGMGIYARQPLLEPATLYRNGHSNNQILRADIMSGEPTYLKRVRLINVHLQSIRLTFEELSIRNRGEASLWANIRSVVRKMRLAYDIRQEQVEVLARAIDESPYPVIVGGDFNETPYSYTYWRIRRQLNNAHEVAGSGVGVTYNGKSMLRFIRIDHQFFGAGLEPVAMRVHRAVDLSDHLPVTVRYQIK